MSAGELLDRNDSDMVERGYAYAAAKQEAEQIAFKSFQVEIGNKDSFGIATAIYLLSRLLARANAY